MKILMGVDFMLYCTQNHPDKEFREQCQLLQYALLGDVMRFMEYVDRIVSNPDKNLVAFYPSFENEDKVKGMEIVGTIIDGRLYFG